MTDLLTTLRQALKFVETERDVAVDSYTLDGIRETIDDPLGIKLIADAEALLAALTEQIAAVERDVWQPIETAPRDGTKVLCFCPGKKRAIMAPSDPYARVDKCISKQWWEQYPEAPYTHWMPLPVFP